MTLVRTAPSDGIRVILCLRFDQRAPADEVAALKTKIIARPEVVHSVDVSGSFDFMIEAAIPDFPSYQTLLDDLAEELARLVERFEANFVCRRYVRDVEEDRRAIWVPCADGRRRVDYDSIDRVQAEGDYVRLHTGDQSWLLHSTMTALRRKLDPSRFVRLHRSTIVRTDFVERLIHQDHHWVARLADGTEQRIAKSHLSKVLSILRADSSTASDGWATAFPSADILTQVKETAVN